MKKINSCFFFILSFAVVNASAERFEIIGSSFKPTNLMLSGGQYALEGTIGQPLVGESLGGGFLLQSGYWSHDNSDLIFIDSFEE